jgi:hypothetical protein
MRDISYRRRMAPMAPRERVWVSRQVTYRGTEKLDLSSKRCITTDNAAIRRGLPLDCGRRGTGLIGYVVDPTICYPRFGVTLPAIRREAVSMCSGRVRSR